MPQLNSHQFEEVYKWLGINLNTLGCIMLDLEPLGFSFDANADDFYTSPDKAKFWIKGFVADETPHITLLYGLLETGKNFEPHIQKVLEGWKLDEVEIESIGFFNSPYPDEPYYCIVAHIKVTPELLEGHQRLEFLPHVNTFTGYKPHLTLAYVKKDDAIRDGWIKFFKQHIGHTMKVKSEINYGGDK